MIRFYQEPNGDYLAVNMEPGALIRQTADKKHWLREGRATAIAGLPTSMATTGLDSVFLATCKRVPQSEVPKEWLDAIGL